MLRRPSLTSDPRAEEAQTLAAQTQDDWERELFERITIQWQALAVHKKGKEEKRTPEAAPTRARLRLKRVDEGPNKQRARAYPTRGSKDRHLRLPHEARPNRRTQEPQRSF